GGSITLNECGVLDFLRGKDYNFYERKEGLTPEEKNAIFKKQHNADIYFSSANAITESGELYNVDGACNRISAIAHGPNKVIIIAGVNKIVKDLECAATRVKTIAAPKNCVRLGYQTPCFKTGRCISLEKKNPAATDGCASENRICCHYLITGFQKIKNRITVILVNEPLGY
ncbi:MAG: lactate utilization protein, partial [Firmicutes bacterium]|nr:lactate utilization protein [Bacillota bacterium]